MPTPHGRSQQPALRIIRFPEPRAQESPPRLSPQMTLTDFFDCWFLPIVLAGERRHAGTIASYRESLAYWSKLTGDPPVAEIDEYTIANLKTGLHQTTYRRGPKSQLRTLAAYTITKHLRQIRTVLRRLGPTHNPDRPGKHLVADLPYIRVEKPGRHTPKRCFTLTEAKQIIAATRDMPTPRHRPAIAPPHWWRAFLLVLFYTGLRTGTALRLRRQMLEARGTHTWLIIPGQITKTGKAAEKYLHPAAAAAIATMDTPNLLFPWQHWPGHIANRHRYLQRLAAIPRERWLSPHAWRRTHATELAKLGAAYGQRIAQTSLDHADAATTADFYCNLEADLIAQMPLIAGPPESLDQGRLF